MLQWSTIRPALVSLFTDLAVDQPAGSGEGDADNPPFTVEWKGRKRSAVHARLGKEITIRVTNVAAIGDDETTYEEIPEGEDDEGLLREVVGGQRKFTLQIQAHCLEDVDFDEDDEPVDDEWGIGVLDRVRSGLYLQTTAERLLEAGMGLIDAGDIRDISRVYDKREWSIATMDVVFCAIARYENPEATGVIEHAELTSEFQVGDTTLPSPPNVTDDWTPPLPE